MNLWAIFLTGLFTGGLTCLAVQGGLLASSIAQQEEDKLKDKAKTTGNALPILAFVVSKLIAYTILGLLLGALGSVVELSLNMKAAMLVVASAFMLGTALNLLNVHPIFRYFAIQPPHFLTKLVRNQAKSKSFFAPAVLGAFTVFIPCGTTQAMMALAIATGDPLAGAAIMFAFVLGTSPIFFLLGYFATKLGDKLHQKFLKLAAYTLIVLAVWNLNGAAALLGSKVTLESLASNIYCTISFCNKEEIVVAGNNQANEPQLIIENSGYSPSAIAIKAGERVNLKLINKGGAGCTQVFVIPSLSIQKTVPLGTTAELAFTAPKEPGELPFMCSMGMFRGKFIVT